MRLTTIKSALILLLAIAACRSDLAAMKPETWGSALIPLGEYKGIQFSFWQQYRVEMSHCKLIDIRYSLYTKKALCRWLDGEIHYTLIHARAVHEKPYLQVFRLEVELNQHFDLTKNVELRLRNRYEYLKRDFCPDRVQRFRQRHRLLWNLEYGCIRTLSIHNELFYSITENRLFEYRFVPLEIGVAFGKGHSYQIYGMLRGLRIQERWTSQLIYGVNLNW